MNSPGLSYLVRQMSKLKKFSKSQEGSQALEPISTGKNGSIVLQIFAKPGAKCNGITGIDKEGISVQINARPIDGEANLELIKYMSSVLGLKKSEISLDKGMKSRQKVIVVDKIDLTVEKVTSILSQEMNQRH